MAKRNPIHEAIERVLQIYDDEPEDFVTMEQARVLLNKLRVVAVEFDALDEYALKKRRMGRHSSSAVRKADRIADFRCFELVEKIHREKHVSMDRACEQAGRQLNKGFDTVKKAYKRARKLLRSSAYRNTSSGMKPDA